MAMLITPERSQRQPARAPRISGIDSVSVPCEMMITLSGIAPASAQHSRDSRKHTSTPAMASRLASRLNGTVARRTPSPIATAPSA